MYKYTEESKYLLLSTINGLFGAQPRLSQQGARCIWAQYDLWPRLQYEVTRPVFRWGFSWTLSHVLLTSHASCLEELRH